MLLGGRANGFHTAMRGPGSGSLWFRYAVKGADQGLDYRLSTGLRSDVSGLREWVGGSSWSWTDRLEAGQPVEQITRIRRPAIPFGDIGGRELSFIFITSIDPNSGGSDFWALGDHAWVETRTQTLSPIAHHSDAHAAIRDLLVLSRWHEETARVVGIQRPDDPLMTLDGRNHGPKWLDVVEAGPRGEPQERHWHLIPYEDIGPEGVVRWFALRDLFSRALDPVITSSGLLGVTGSTHLAQVGPGLEALGFLLLHIRDGLPVKQAGDTRLAARLDRVLHDVSTVLPFDTEGWSQGFADVYNALKHANRAAPDDIDVLNAWREGVLLTRAWVALELGVPPELVKERLETDPQRYPYEPVPE